MLSFSAEFPITLESVQDCATVVKKWVAGSPHTTISEMQLSQAPATGQWKVESEGECLRALVCELHAEEIGAFRHTKRDNGIEWNTEAVFSRKDGDTWVGIRTSRESDQPQLVLPNAKKPYLVRAMLEQAGGGLDGELYVRDTPYELRENDLPMVARLLNGDSDNYLPIVYVSSYFDGNWAIDFRALARSLGGLAHVLVEPAPSFAPMLQDLTSSRNAYNGAVGVYWPSGEHYRYFPGGDYQSEQDLRNTLADRLRISLLNRRPLSRCTWARAETEAARAVFSDLRSQGSQDVDAYIRAFDAELAAARQELSDAEREIDRLRNKPSINLPASDRSPVYAIGEVELYQGEFESIVLDELSKALNSVQSDSRRQHILEAAISSSANRAAARDKKNVLKTVLRDYSSMGSSERRGLEALGFVITDEGKHYKLTFYGDDRYTFSLPKSGSDHRGGLNAASDIGKRLF
jgi:hypothetical protein